MNIIHKPAQAIGETLGMDEQITLGITSAKETVIDIDVVIATILETEFHHCIGLSLDDRIIDLETIGIP